MRAAIYNPYLDTLGGGERYSMAFAKALSENGYKVDVQWQNEKIKRNFEERFGMNLSGVKIVKDIKKAIAKFPGVGRVKVEVIRNKLWSADMASEEVRTELDL